MEVLVLGNQSKTKCEEGDKIRLTFFEVSNNRGKIQLKSGPCSIYKVWKFSKEDIVLCCLSEIQWTGYDREESDM